MSEICIKSPKLLTVADGRGAQTMGGDQYWLPKEGFIPGGACGATAASNMLAYLLRTRPELYALAAAAGLDGLAAPAAADGKRGIAGQARNDRGLYAQENKRLAGAQCAPLRSDESGDIPFNDRLNYIEFMKKVYRFLYPRIAGLMAGEFLEGMGKLAEEYGLPIMAEGLRVPVGRSKRPSFAEAAEFVGASLEADIPAAFLILSNGCVANLDTWHWVTILALNKETKQVEIADNGQVFRADLEQWLDTSIMGGSFVRLCIKGNGQQQQYLCK